MQPFRLIFLNLCQQRPFRDFGLNPSDNGRAARHMGAAACFIVEHIGMGHPLGGVAIAEGGAPPSLHRASPPGTWASGAAAQDNCYSQKVGGRGGYPTLAAGSAATKPATAAADATLPLAKAPVAVKTPCSSIQ